MTSAAAVQNRQGAGSADLAAYWHQAAMPLTSLMFVLPLIVVYEVGTRYFTTAAQHGHDQQVIAFTMMQRFFRWFGVHGQHLPALAVVTVLLAWHIARNDPWHFQLSTLLGMAAESGLLALPLILLGAELARHFALSAVHTVSRDRIIMSIGAGVYEELIFRLILFSIISLFLKDALQMRAGWVHLAVVVVSALAFSAYHYLSPVEKFQWRPFVFRTVAGGYFGVIFLVRGFGVTAASHTFYDVLIQLL